MRRFNSQCSCAPPARPCLAPLMLFTTTLLIARNQRILAAWNARQAENTRRAATGLPPKTRRRRRKTLTALIAAARPP